MNVAPVVRLMNRRSLKSIPIFKGLSPEILDLLAQLIAREQYAAGEVIFRQGERADKLHVLQSGLVEIRLKPYDGEILTVAMIESGGVFGWSAALGRRDYTSDAVAIEDGKGMSIRGDDLRSFCEDHPESGILLLERLAEVISARLRNTHQKVMELLQQGLAPNNDRMPGKAR